MVKYKRLNKLQWFKQPHPAFSLAPETHEELYSFKFDDSDVQYGFFRQEAICLSWPGYLLTAISNSSLIRWMTRIKVTLLTSHIIIAAAWPFNLTPTVIEVEILTC